MNEILTTTLTALNWLAINIPWDVIIAAGILSPIGLYIKKKRNIESDKVMLFIIILLSTIAAVGSYLLTVTTADPSIIAAKSALIYFTSQPIYILCLRPAYGWLSAELAKARAFDAEVKSAAIPAEGLPVSSAQ